MAGMALRPVTEVVTLADEKFSLDLPSSQPSKQVVELVQEDTEEHSLSNKIILPEQPSLNIPASDPVPEPTPIPPPSQPPKELPTPREALEQAIREPIPKVPPSVPPQIPPGILEPEGPVEPADIEPLLPPTPLYGRGPCPDFDGDSYDQCAPGQPQSDDNPVDCVDDPSQDPPGIGCEYIVDPITECDVATSECAICINPGMPELCDNALDDDCNLMIDCFDTDSTCAYPDCCGNGLLDPGEECDYDDYHWHELCGLPGDSEPCIRSFCAELP
jgi:hypothetical protein